MACTDIDECADPTLSNCDLNASCENSDGTFSCTCNAGYNGDGTTCSENTPGALCPSDQCWSESGNDCILKSNADCGHALTCGADQMTFTFPEQLFGISDPTQFVDDPACLPV